MSDEHDRFASELSIVMEAVKQLLIDKNKKYGNSALRPIGVFSKLDPIEAINIRLDDKLKRIQNQSTDEDAELDLLGYLLLKRVYMLRK